MSGFVHFYHASIHQVFLRYQLCWKRVQPLISGRQLDGRNRLAATRNSLSAESIRQDRFIVIRETVIFGHVDRSLNDANSDFDQT